MVERKGAGHPDTLCDLVAEELSRALSLHYIEKAGRILHHNLDKCVLAGGRSEVSYGGGRVLEPMEFILIGRASDGAFPLEDVARGAVEHSLSERLRYLDVNNDIKVEVKIRPGSRELVQVFDSPASMPLANDTSMGVGYAPLSPLEGLALELDEYLGSTPFRESHPEVGEDVKILAVRSGTDVHLAVAAAFVDRHVRSAGDYLEKKRSVAAMLELKAGDLHGRRVSVSLNAADREKEGVFYLTVTGTSAESGDDGAVGRGNRVNGLITPYRPMVMEATAGKNPVNHVGKLYNVAASNMAFALSAVQGIRETQVYMVSLIGSPIDRPQLINVKLRTELSEKELHHAVELEVQNTLGSLGGLWRGLLEGRHRLF